MRKTVCVAVAIWIVSLLLAIPDLVSTYVNTCGMIPYCSAYHYDWGAWYPKFRTIFRFVVLFACPLIIIAVFYVIIAFALVHRSRDTFYALHAGDANVRQLDSRRKVINAKAVLSNGPQNMDFDNLSPILGGISDTKWDITVHYPIRWYKRLRRDLSPWGSHQPGGPKALKPL